MEQHSVLVAGQVHVALDAVDAVGDRLKIGGTGVLGEGLAGAAVGVDERTGGGELLGGHADTLADVRTGCRARLGTCR